MSQNTRLRAEGKRMVTLRLKENEIETGFVLVRKNSSFFFNVKAVLGENQHGHVIDTR